MATLLKQYLSETNQKGYIVEENEHPISLTDRGTFIHIVCPDTNEGGWLVGRWYKSTCTSTGDYSGQPDFESESLEECLVYVRDWQAI